MTFRIKDTQTGKYLEYFKVSSSMGIVFEFTKSETSALGFIDHLEAHAIKDCIFKLNSNFKLEVAKRIAC
ncbi:hypothetical protein ACQWTT_001134 [Acinetobacter baumannii]